MKKNNVIPFSASDDQSARRKREEQYQSQIPTERPVENRSGIEIKPLYKPAEAMTYTLSSTIRYAQDCIGREFDPETFLRRFTFFFDISISFFEKIAKLRAGRRIWQQVARERFGIRNPNTWRSKFHGQTSGADLASSATA